MTNALAESLTQLARDLDRMQAAWALIGGFAVSVWVEPRFTRDVDVCVLVDDDASAERTALELRNLGYTVTSVVEHEYRDRLATVRLVSPVSGGILIDLLFASSGIEPEIVTAATALEIVPGLVVPVAGPAELVVLKLLARDDDLRPQDAADLVALRPTLTEADVARVRDLSALVVARGFDRERDLVGLAHDYLHGR